MEKKYIKYNEENYKLALERFEDSFEKLNVKAEGTYKVNIMYLNPQELYKKSRRKSDFVNNRIAEDMANNYVLKTLKILNLNEYKFKNKKEYKDIKNYCLVKLNTLYRAYASEEFKIFEFLRQSKKENLNIEITTSKILDDTCGIDFIVLLNNSKLAYIHSICGSNSSYRHYLNKSKLKVHNQEFEFDREKYYKMEDHFYLKDFNKNCDYKRETIISNIKHNVTVTIKNILNKKTTGKLEFINTVKYLNKTKEKELLIYN